MMKKHFMKATVLAGVLVLCGMLMAVWALPASAAMDEALKIQAQTLGANGDINGLKALALADPDAAAEIAAVAAAANPDMAAAIAAAIAEVLPDKAVEIAAAVAAAVPDKALAIASAVAAVLPDQANQIADAVNDAVAEKRRERERERERAGGIVQPYQ